MLNVEINAIYVEIICFFAIRIDIFNNKCLFLYLTKAKICAIIKRYLNFSNMKGERNEEGNSTIS